MQLKRLEIVGFKSFAKKSDLSFDTPVTAIVGPNGSGKSNVVEAIRFVLGEQSMKSLRGKLGADLIFKGSKFLPKQSRAGVTIVFDNTNRIFTLPSQSGQEGGLRLDFDEVSVSREVYGDGANRYLINGTEARLKDILELLASVNIGSSGHHIISQGEADRILNASAKERRAMIEDALGLKVYQYRIRESERKLEKTGENIKEAETLRREIVPHLNFLKKQVEKYEKAVEMRTELEGLYGEYLKREEIHIAREAGAIGTERRTLEAKLAEISGKLGVEQEVVRQKTASEAALETLEAKIREIASLKDELSRKLGRIEGMIEHEERRQKREAERAEKGPTTIPVADVESLVADIASNIDLALGKQNFADIGPILASIKQAVLDFIPKRKASGESASFDVEEMEKMRAGETEIRTQLEKIAAEERALYDESARLRHAIDEEKAAERREDQARFALVLEKKELTSALGLVAVREESLGRLKEAFLQEVREGSVLVGSRVFAYKDFQVLEGEDGRERQEERRRAIERIKIKLEDIGAGGGDDIMKEYGDVSARNEFLLKEIDDLKTTIASLEDLIRTLKENLDAEFQTGMAKINAQFDAFFALMFGGGHASLAIVEPKRKKSDDDEEISDEIPDEEEFERGIEISVSLPHKKVRELAMLSGGERSLTSIALLFAISQVNPPPFLVLDETDAALDEANSRKYGDMIENLSKYSQLIVVTHNRETMSRANVLYGVTIGADGGSKLLSIKFDEAAAIAK